MRFLYFLILLFCYAIPAYSQYFANENKVWIFGSHARVDFTSGSPVAGGVSPATVLEGGSCVSNSVGELLFNTDGDTVFNRLGLPMPHGSNITSFITWSTSQSAAIVPFPGDTNKYYIFSLEAQVFIPDGYCHLSYSVVDMSLDDGLGDVVVGAADIGLNEKMGEKLVVVSGDNCNMWVVAHKKDTTLFYVYEVGPAGIGFPAVYDVGVMPTVPGIYGSFCNGVMKCSPDRQHLFMATMSFNLPDRGHGQLFDFDPATGVVSNFRPVVPNEGLYGAEFSPDNSKIYVTSLDSNSIYQYDISLSTLALIQASRTKVSTGIVASDIKLAPDGKLYFAGSGYLGHSLGCIPYPNNAGIACGFNPAAVDLTPYAPQMGMPNLFWRSPRPLLFGSTAMCVGDAVTYTASIPGGTWTSSNPSFFSIDAATGTGTALSAGIDTLIYSTPDGCDVNLVVTVNISPAPLGDMTSLCTGDTFTLVNAVAGGTWVSSDTAVGTVVAGSGIFSALSSGSTVITYYVGGCYSTAMVTVVDCPDFVASTVPGGAIAVYPVPVAESLHVRFPANYKEVAILKIYDMAGRLLLTERVHPGENSISAVALPPGAFHCTVSDARGNILLRKQVNKL